MGVLALLGALVLLVGVPVCLALFVGNPLPTSAPSSDWLDAQVTPDLLINVVAVIVWVVWAHFVVCFLTEWRAIRSGRVPGNVLLGGGSQLLARQLVATILLLAGGASVASGVSAAVADAPGQGPAVTRVSVDRDAAAGAVAHGGADVRQASDDRSGASREAPKKITTVKPPLGRHHDSLWGIAERTLGDGFRYKEIFELNKDRLMPDGRRLTDADLIQPGWQLVLPADAKGADVHVLQDNTPVPARHPGDGVADPAAERAALADGAAGATVSGDLARDAASGQTGEQGSQGIVQLLLGGGLILAGVLRALTAKRGPFGDAEPATDELALAANVARAEFLDLALRSLCEQRTGQGRDMPDLRFVYLSDDQLVLHLLGSAEAPEAPWAVSDDGRAWTLRRADLVRPGADVAAPYPALVNLGETHGFDVLVDLEMAPGLVALAGDGGVARDVAQAMALDLATHRWSDEVEVLLVGFADGVDLGDDRVRRIGTVEELLAHVSARSARQSAALERLGVQGVLQGRQRGVVTESRPVVALLSGQPSSQQAQELAALIGHGRSSFSVVCVGDSASARWRLIVDAAGTLEATALGISCSARRLTVDAQRQLVDLFAAAARSRAEGTRQLDNTPPAEIAVQAAVARTESARRVHDAEVTVRLLGPVRVDTPGEVDEARRALLTEVVVMAALHPDGLHEAVLTSSLWPRGVEPDVVEARLADAERWVGHDAQGRPRLHRGEDGRLHLSPEVASDYAALAAAVAATGEGELDRLLTALRLGSGEVFSGAGYHWMVFAREARQCRTLVTSAARRAAELAVSAGRRDEADEALTRGLAMVPTAEVLWRLLLKLRAEDRPGELDRTISDLQAALRHAGAQPEAETQALVAELAPDVAQAAGS